MILRGVRPGVQAMVGADHVGRRVGNRFALLTSIKAAAEVVPELVGQGLRHFQRRRFPDHDAALTRRIEAHDAGGHRLGRPARQCEAFSCLPGRPIGLFELAQLQPFGCNLYRTLPHSTAARSQSRGSHLLDSDDAAPYALSGLVIALNPTTRDAATLYRGSPGLHSPCLPRLRWRSLPKGRPV